MPRVSADTKVRGIVVQALTSNMRADELMPILTKFKVDKIDPNAWYLVSDLMEVAQEIFAQRRAADAMFDLVAIGMSSANVTPLPPEIDCMEKLVQTWEMRWQYLYQGTDTGYIKVEFLNKTHMLVRIRNSWPDDLNYGNLYSNVKRVLPAGSTMKVYYDREAKRADHGGDETLLHIEWTEPRPAIKEPADAPVPYPIHEMPKVTDTQPPSERAALTQ